METYNARLRIMNKGASPNQEKGEEYNLGQRTVIGRQDDVVDFYIMDSKISRRHCCISEDGGIFSITDLHSSNGTYVENKLITTSTILGHMNTIRIGTVSLLFIKQPEDIADPKTRTEDGLTKDIDAPETDDVEGV